VADASPHRSEGRRRKAPPQRIPRPANDNAAPGTRRRLAFMAVAAFSALAILALSVAG
jgi:hypothetical protein